MKNAIILHGLAGKDEYYDERYPNGSNSHWLPWLQKHLMINEVKADTPEVPRPFEFNYESWVSEVERFETTSQTTLVGHSMGGGFWIRYLTEHPEVIVDRVILVAPWVNVNHEEDTDFFDFEIDPAIAEQANKFVIFASDNDSLEVQNSIAFLRNTLQMAILKDFHNYGHFTLKHMGTPVFPELLDACL